MAGLPSARHEAGAFGAQGDDLLVRRKLHDARLSEERGRVGREEHLTLADADHERHSVLAGADEEPGMVVMDHDEGKVPLELRERQAHGLDEVALVVALDEMRNGLGVGLRAERVPVGGEVLGELAVVLDDPVQDDRELRRLAARERVGVRLGDPAVRRPARVPETRSRARPVGPRALLQVPKGADGADVVEAVRLEERDPGGVVAAVLEPLESLDEQGLALPRADVSDDSAHG